MGGKKPLVTPKTSGPSNQPQQQKESYKRPGSAVVSPPVSKKMPTSRPASRPSSRQRSATSTPTSEQSTSLAQQAAQQEAQALQQANQLQQQQSEQAAQQEAQAQALHQANQLLQHQAQQIAELQQQLKNLQSAPQIIPQTNNNNNEPIQYQASTSQGQSGTEAPELPFISITKGASTSSQNISPSFKIQTNNSFQALQDEEPMQVNEPNRAYKPPPIYLRAVTNYMELCHKLKEICGGPAFTCKCRSTEIQILSKTPDAYRTIIRYLNETNADYHTYQCKEDKAFRIVIRHLHPSTPPISIKQELTNLGYKVKNVANVLHPVDKRPLSLFFVDLEPQPNNKQIFDLDYLCDATIEVEEPRKQRSIVQCKRCQQYGHTKAYCNHAHQCVKCAGDHPTENCKKPPTTPATCVLCTGAHPANYRGCQIHKDLQATRRPSQGARPFQNLRFQPAPPPPSQKFSYAQAAGPSSQNFSRPQVTGPAAPAAPLPPLHPQPPHTFQPPPPPNDTTNALQALLTDVNRTMNLLIELLTKLLPRLT